MFDAELLVVQAPLRSQASIHSWLKNYKSALEMGVSRPYDARLRIVSCSQTTISNTHTATAFKILAKRLITTSSQVTPKNAEQLAGRVVRALAGRPRLALTDAERVLVQQWAEALWPTLRPRVAAWVKQLEDDLEHSEPSLTEQPKAAPLNAAVTRCGLHG